ncbi:hypothetical protein NUKP41_04500 [Klebsiella variicola]|nr:hypothetical protein NUKP41_04500 [Klebsiella variicola]GKL55180.1 hypothetical protein NUKP61_25690 [Klebsiella variicola]GKN76943.1 hypothetical protein NUKP88_04550 [Klebsiella variicola]
MVRREDKICLWSWGKSNYSVESSTGLGQSKHLPRLANNAQKLSMALQSKTVSED